MFFFTGCQYNGQEITDGKTWKPYGDQDPCFECTCENGDFSCVSIAEKCPPIDCDNAVADVGECCPKCPGQLENIIFNPVSAEDELVAIYIY